MIRTGGARFNPDEGNIVFIASNTGTLSNAIDHHGNVLIAVNEITSDKDIGLVSGWADGGANVFIDSGIFSLTQEHKKAHGISMDEALGLAPEKIDGFQKLFDRYINIVELFRDRCWGYIELDQGGMHNKIKTRAKLEGMGLRPIPVYHPFNDGWDYFDYLAENYDRICFGNIVQANQSTRDRLIATAWERKRKHPKLWIHLLGYTPNQNLYSYPINSGDSSAWISPLRWSDHRCHANGTNFAQLSVHYRYKLGDAEERDKMISILGRDSKISEMNWRHSLQELKDLGFETTSP